MVFLVLPVLDESKDDIGGTVGSGVEKASRLVSADGGQSKRAGGASYGD